MDHDCGQDVTEWFFYAMAWAWAATVFQRLLGTLSYFPRSISDLLEYQMYSCSLSCFRIRDVLLFSSAFRTHDASLLLSLFLSLSIHGVCIYEFPRSSLTFAVEQ